MAKEQKRGNREVRKPKKEKASVAAPIASVKSLTAPASAPKKKI